MLTKEQILRIRTLTEEVVSCAVATEAATRRQRMAEAVLGDYLDSLEKKEGGAK